MPIRSISTSLSPRNGSSGAVSRMGRSQSCLALSRQNPESGLSALSICRRPMPGPRLGPGIGRRHIDNADSPDSGFWRLNAKQLWLLPILDTAPELPFRGDNEVLIERIGMGQYLYPLASTGNDGKHRGP